MYVHNNLYDLQNAALPSSVLGALLLRISFYKTHYTPEKVPIIPILFAQATRSA